MRAGEGLEGGTHVAGRLFPRPAAATGGASQTKHVGTGSEVGFGLANLSTIVEGIIVQMQMHVFMNLPQVQSAVIISQQLRLQCWAAAALHPAKLSARNCCGIHHLSD